MSYETFFAVFTADSTFPFALLWCGDVVVYSMPHVFVKDLNLLDVNWGPLSVTSCSGILYRAICDFNLIITVDDSVLAGEPNSLKLDL